MNKKFQTLIKLSRCYGGGDHCCFSSSELGGVLIQGFLALSSLNCFLRAFLSLLLEIIFSQVSFMANSSFFWLMMLSFWLETFWLSESSSSELSSSRLMLRFFSVLVLPLAAAPLFLFGDGVLACFFSSAAPDSMFWGSSWSSSLGVCFFFFFWSSRALACSS